MSYPQLRGTMRELNQFLDSIRQDEMMYEEQARAGRGIFDEFLTFCRDYGIIYHFNEERVDAIFTGLTREDETE